MSNDTPTFRFLATDFANLERNIEGIKAQLAEAMRLSAESVEQSSESFHDNYTFEEAQRQIKMLLNHLGGLSKALEHSLVVEVDPRPTTVDVGVEVNVEDVDLRENWSFTVGSYMVSDRLRDEGFVSYEAPLAALLLGAVEGEERAGRIGGRDTRLRVRSIRPSTAVTACDVRTAAADEDGGHHGR